MTATGPADAGCPACLDEFGAGAMFCEACGRALRAGPPPTSPATVTPPGTDPALQADPQAPPHGTPATGTPAPGAPAGPTSGCPACGADDAVADDGYCTQCGMLVARPRDHLEFEVDGAAAVTDRGRRRHRNEDHVWLSGHDGAVDVVVCDGVSVSFDPDVASEQATAVAGAALQRAAVGSTADIVAAVGAAADAVAALATTGDPRRAASNPACTVVAACVRGAVVSYGWVGDSRAYWVPAVGPVEQLTEDDSWAVHAVRNGVDAREAARDRRAHAITAWLGADAGPVAPRTATFTASQPGHLLLCSDGLWNYLSDPLLLGETLRAALESTSEKPATALSAARMLTAFANAAGGSDNITVAIVEVPAGRAA